MKVKILFGIAGIGVLAGIVSAIVYNEKVVPQPPIAVSQNPYIKGIYATGITESDQPLSSNVNIFPEVSGKVMAVFVREDQMVKKNDPILQINDSVQRGLVEKDSAQIRFEQASLVNVEDQLKKINKSYSLDTKSVSQNVRDNAINAVKITQESVEVANKQYASDKALLDKYFIRSPIDGVIFRIGTTPGDYISPQGTFDTYSQAMLPVVQLGVVTPYMHVRCFVDEILVPHLPAPAKLAATMFIRGENNRAIPLEYVSIQPYTVPKIQLSNERTERVDVRVLPIIFKFKRPSDINIFPGQLVDVFIKGKP